MRIVASVVALFLSVAGAPAWGQGDDAKEEVLARIAQLAGKMSSEELATELAGPLGDGTLLLGDLEGLLFEAEPARRAVLAAAARQNLTPENIRRTHAQWHPGDSDDEQLEETSDFLHCRFFELEGRALLELGRAEEAAARLGAMGEHTRVSALGLSMYPYEARLAQALNAMGEHRKALECITPVYAIAGTAWMRPALEAAYAGAGFDPQTLDAYVTARRAELAVEMPAFDARDYEGRSVSFEEVRGEVTVITTWFPNCYGCRLELPFLQELEDRYRERGLRVVAVETTRATDAARAYREEHYGFATFPFLENGPPDADVLESQLGANGNATFLVSRDNKVVLAWSGWGEHLEPELEKRVLEELGGSR